MSRRRLLTPADRTLLMSVPDAEDTLIQLYSLSEVDLSWIHQHRGAHNRIGFAVLLCYMRFPGILLGSDKSPNERLLHFLAEQLELNPSAWHQYALRAQTRREHALEIQAGLGLRGFTKADYRPGIQWVERLALQTEQGLLLGQELIRWLRQQRILLPSVEVIERLCAEALLRANRRIYHTLTDSLGEVQKLELERLLEPKAGSHQTWLGWLRQSLHAPNPKHMLEHIERYKAVQALGLPDALTPLVHQNRRLKLAREGGRMTAQHLRELEPLRRYATLVAMLVEMKATILDELIEGHERILGAVFAKAKRSQEHQFQKSGKAINRELRRYVEIGEALLTAKQTGLALDEAVEAVVSWEELACSVSTSKTLTQPASFDFLPQAKEQARHLRRYAPALLEVLPLQATPAAQPVMAGLETLKTFYQGNGRKLPEDAPTGFIRPRWQELVLTETGLDRRGYELCALEALKNTLRSGDMSVSGSRQFKDFEMYLVPQAHHQEQKAKNQLKLAVKGDSHSYLKARCQLLSSVLEQVEHLAHHNQLPDARFGDSGLTITPLDKAVPDEVKAFSSQVYALLPRVKITELLLEVDAWTGFTEVFTHLKTDLPCMEKPLLLTTILSDAINLGLVKMAEASPQASYSKLSWIQAWHIRDETYTAATATLVNAQMKQPFAAWWGDGSTASSDGQRFATGGHSQTSGQVNPKYGSYPGKLLYTHISDQYTPFYTQVINATVRDATYVLDGLLHHESDLVIEEHYTDTAGFTDHVFALMHLLGFRFAPRIRDLADKRLYTPDKTRYPNLKPMLGDPLNLKIIEAQWDELLRLASSIRQGTVSASLMLRKLGSYPRQNSLALALREVGRIERTLFLLEWMQDADLRRRVQIGLNKGEARNALARAVFFNRLGEFRDRELENQQYRASGLNLVIAAITLWNTVYLEKAIQALGQRQTLDTSLLPHLSPLHWEHINLTGDYHWPQKDHLPPPGHFRPLQIP